MGITISIGYDYEPLGIGYNYHHCLSPLDMTITIGYDYHHDWVLLQLFNSHCITLFYTINLHLSQSALI